MPDPPLPRIEDVSPYHAMESKMMSVYRLSEVDRSVNPELHGTEAKLLKAVVDYLGNGAELRSLVCKLLREYSEYHLSPSL